MFNYKSSSFGPRWQVNEPSDRLRLYAIVRLRSYGLSYNSIMRLPFGFCIATRNGLTWNLPKGICESKLSSGSIN